VPRLCKFYHGICLTPEEKARKDLSQGKKNLSQVKKNLSQSIVHILPKHPQNYKTSVRVQYTYYQNTHTLQNLSQSTVYVLPKHPHITKPSQTHYKTHTYTNTRKHAHTLNTHTHTMRTSDYVMDWVVWCSNPGEGQDIFLQIIYTNFGIDPTCCSVRIGYRYRRQREREMSVYDSPPSSAEVKEEYSYTSILPRSLMAWKVTSLLLRSLVICVSKLCSVLCQCCVLFRASVN
jgi:hypothetical protein